MRSRSKFLLAICLALMLAGCAEADDVLFKSLAGEAPGQPARNRNEKAVAAEALGRTPPPLGTGDFRTGPVIAPQPAGDATSRTVEDLVDQFRELSRDVSDRNAELQQLRAALAARTQDYLDAKAVLDRRVTSETWKQSRLRLDMVYLQIDRLNALATKVDIDQRSIEQILASAREARGLEGLDETEKGRLATVSREAEQTKVLLHKMLGEIHDDISNQNEYADTQRERLVQVAKRLNLKPTETAARSYEPAPVPEPAPEAEPAPEKVPEAKPRPGAEQATREKPAAAAAKAMPEKPVAETAKATPPPAKTTREPLVVIRFNKPHVDYARPLYRAVSYAVDKKPDVRFDVVAVTPHPVSGNRLSAESGARLQGVLQTLADMGVPTSRVNLSSEGRPDAASDEVYIYVR